METRCAISRLITLLFLIGLGLVSWLGMQIVHEFGHVLAAWSTGGTVVKVILHPLHISETVVQPKPFPRLVIWAGPLLGCLLPGLFWIPWRRQQTLLEACLRFFTGFCLIANGAYLGMAWLLPVGDALDLVHLGTSKWQLGLFGAMTFPLGLWCWNGLGARLGIGKEAAPVTVLQMLGINALLGTIILCECLWSSKL